MREESVGSPGAGVAGTCEASDGGGGGVGWGWRGAGNESRSSGRVRSSLDQLVADAAPQMPQTAGAAESEQVRCGKS